MPLPNVIINIVRNSLGAVAQTVDGIMGLCLTGVAVADTLILDTPYPIYSLQDAVDLGIDDSGDNINAYKQIKEYYDVASTGSKLWIIVSANDTTIEKKVDKAEVNCVARMLIEAGGGEISVIGICWTPAGDYNAVILDGLDSKVYQAVINADVLAADEVAQIMPVVFLIEGVGYTGTGSNLRDMTGESHARAAIVLAATTDDKSGAIGLTLGRLSMIPVQRKISRVIDGSVPVLQGYLTSGDTIDSKLNDLETIHDKGFVIFRKFPGKSGYYFNGDPTCTVVSDDLHTISNNRVINKALKITYNTYVQHVDDEIFVKDDGTLDPIEIASLQAEIERNINLNMGGEISKFEAYIDPKQNIISTSRLEIVLRITPVGYMSQIVVSLGFKNPSIA